MLKIRRSAPKVMVYGELGRHDIRITVWKRIAVWKKLIKSNDKLSCIVFHRLNYKNKVTLWHLAIKQILISCGILMAEEYAVLVSDSELNKFMKTKCQDLSIQSWQTMLQTNSVCDNYRLYKNRPDTEPYLETLLGSDRANTANLRCASTALPTAKLKLLNSLVESCPFCETRCTPHEYHLSLKCESFIGKRKELLPKYYTYPNDIKYDQLLNVTDKIISKNLAFFLHHIVTRCSSTDNDVY